MADNFFKKTVLDLDTGTDYVFNFAWKYSDKTTSKPSVGYKYTTSGNKPADLPTKAVGLTAKAGAFCIVVSWTGAYDTSSFKGFKAVNIYASTTDLGSSTTTNLESKLVGTMNVNNTANSVTVPVEALKTALSLTTTTVYSPIYLYYATLNADNVLYKENNTVTYYKVTDSPQTPLKTNYVDLASGVISIENLTASTAQFLAYLRAGVRSSDGTGARVEISGSDANYSPPTYQQDGFTRGGGTIYPGLTIYNSDGSIGFRSNNSGDVLFSGLLRSTTATITSPYSQTHDGYIEIPKGASDIRFYPKTIQGQTNAGRYGSIEVSETEYGGVWDQASITIFPPTYKTNGNKSSSYLSIYEDTSTNGFIRMEASNIRMFSQNIEFRSAVSSSSSADDGEIVFYPGYFGTGAVYVANDQPTNFAALRNIEASTSAPSHNSSSSGYKVGDIYFQHSA